MSDFTPRPTTYRGIQMRSRLEAGFAAWLDEWNFEWSYEPQAFASERGQYLPDFRIDVQVFPWKKTYAYVEVKPATFRIDENLQAAMSIIWDSEAEAFLLVAQPRHPSQTDRPEHASIVMLQPPHAAPYYMPWVPVPGSPGRLALAQQVSATCEPWPDGFWRPTPRTT